jgi:hypothetical protein
MTGYASIEAQLADFGQRAAQIFRRWIADHHALLASLLPPTRRRPSKGWRRHVHRMKALTRSQPIRSL